MKAEELIAGKYYVVTYDEKDRYLFLNVDNSGISNQPYIRLEYKLFGKNGQLSGLHNSCFVDNESYREARASEIKHLDACIKAEGYVEAPIEEIINDYQIY